jgi:hypothetical protein
MRKEIKPLITYATLGILLLVFGFYSSTMQYAHAQTFQLITGLAYPIKAMFYQSSNDLIWVLTSDSSSSKTILYWYDRSTLSQLGSFNHTSTMGGNRPVDLWCGKTDCFITTSGLAVADNGQVLKISTENIAPDIFRGQNLTGFYTHTQGLGKITGRDEVSGGFGTITLWVDACQVDVNCQHRVLRVDGISMLNAGFDAVTFGTNNLERVHAMQWSGISGTIDNDLVGVKGTANALSTANDLFIIDLSIRAVACSVDIPTLAGENEGFDVSTNYIGAGNPNNKIYVSSNNGVIYVYNDNCVLQQTVNATQTGLSSDVRYLEYGGGRIFTQETGANAKISQLLTNSSGHVVTSSNATLYFPLPSVPQTAYDPTFTQMTRGNMILFSGFGKLWFPYTDSEKEIGILTYTEVPSAGQTTICYVVEATGQKFCQTYDVDEDGNIILPSVIGGVNPRNITDTSNELFCSLGITDCDNSDITTNGTGMFMLLILVIVSYAFVVAIHHFAHSPLSNINPMFVLLIAIVDITIAFFLGWIPDYIFYSVLVLLIGLGGFGLYRIIRGV